MVPSLQSCLREPSICFLKMENTSTSVEQTTFAIDYGVIVRLRHATFQQFSLFESPDMTQALLKPPTPRKAHAQISAIIRSLVRRSRKRNVESQAWIFGTSRN